MIPGEILAQTFKSNLWLINRHTEGISQEDSVFQPPYQGNCINWILGHLLYNRTFALSLLGASFVWEDEELTRYQTGTEPIRNPKEGAHLDTLLDGLERSQIQLEGLLSELSTGALERVVTSPRGERPLWQELSGLGWHETYHTGQLELLKQILIEAKET
jgi:hypothetical protein